MIKLTLPVQPGNSGRALVDENGNVFGIIVARLDAKIKCIKCVLNWSKIENPDNLSYRDNIYRVGSPART